MTQSPAFGNRIPAAVLFLTRDSAFSDTVRNNDAAWSDPPVLEFLNGDAWTSVLDPTDAHLAVFTEARSAVNARTDREEWRLRNVTTDEVVAQGQVCFQ